MSNNIFEPLQLARGSHKAGSGKGCAMNVISWENGDSVITDYPACSDPFLSRMVQNLNDALAGDSGLLSPENSIIALDLGHATVGTAYHTLTHEELKVVYLKLALRAGTLAGLESGPGTQVARQWLVDPSADTKAKARYITNPDAIDIPVYEFSLADAVAADHPADVAEGGGEAILEVSYHIGFGSREHVDMTRELIEEFKRLTGTESILFPESVFQEAVCNLQKVNA